MRILSSLAVYMSLWTAISTAVAQTADQEAIQALLRRIEQQDRRIEALEAKLASQPPPAPLVAPAPAVPAPATATPTATAAPLEAEQASSMEGHNMEIPGGGPTLKIRGFFDFNYGTGSIANPLIFPIASNGCETCGYAPTPPHNGFQAGEFDLFMTSKLSEHLSFLAETIFGADTSNQFSIDIERYQLTYRLNEYFSASGGRFHTAIGYYNTAYHHGNWFSTAEGRPIMYLFEDSGGVLPVHTVGVTMTGLVPGSGSLGLHWIAETGNGRSSNPAAVEPVQNFYADRNRKAVNLAAFIRPERLRGLQIGGSYYHDQLAPPGIARVNQSVASGYAVYITQDWEFMNEGVLLSNRLEGRPGAYRSPMAYTQLSRKFGIYRPYFRYQYVNDRRGDPVNILQGTLVRPVGRNQNGLQRVCSFQAAKYNHLFSGNLPGSNGLNAQVAFTF